MTILTFLYFSRVDDLFEKVKQEYTEEQLFYKFAATSANDLKKLMRMYTRQLETENISMNDILNACTQNIYDDWVNPLSGFLRLCELKGVPYDLAISSNELEPMTVHFKKCVEIVYFLLIRRQRIQSEIPGR